ncbi:MAG: AMP-binding protein, partial [Phenylobacterium sp.]
MQRPAGKTLGAVLAETAHAAPQSPAIFYGDRVISYGELLGQVEAAARALLALDVGAGDRVAVLLGNDPDWVILALAASTIGAGFAPLNTWYKSAELAWTLRHCNVKVLISASHFLKTDYRALFSDLIPELSGASPSELNSAAFPSLRSLAFMGPPPPGALAWRDAVALGARLPEAALRAARAAVDPDTTAFILYTSGSTADPKGVLLNHRVVVENGFDLGQRRAITGEDRVWLGTPLFYGLGATNALPATLTAGASLVLQGHFEAGSAIETIHRTGATVYYGTGNMTRGMLDHPDFSRAKVGSLQKGNAGTVAEYKRLTLVEMGIRRAVPAYGLTESYGNATVGEADDPLEAKISTNGRPLPGTELLIVD